MIKFERVERFKDADFDMPVRKTGKSGGFDMVIAEDVVIPPHISLWNKMAQYSIDECIDFENPLTLDEIADLTKASGTKPTLVTTGCKVKIPDNCTCDLVVRSSTPYKYWLMEANSIGIIDADYYGNPDNDGEIFFQLYNMSPFSIQLKKGDIIGQALIREYRVTDDDKDQDHEVRVGGHGSTTK